MLDPVKAKKIFAKLYENVSGSSISLAGREARDYKSKSFVYGEVIFDSFPEILKELDLKAGETFVDFGSGTGKAVFLAYLLTDCAKAAGVELVETLYDKAEEVRQRFEREFKPGIKKEFEGREIVFISANFLDVDISNVDVMFMNSTCFQDELMEPLEQRLETMKPGARLVLLSKPLKSPQFTLTKQEKRPFSWGDATAFFYVRNPVTSNVTESVGGQQSAEG